MDMELTIDIKYDQILELARQLPNRYKKKLSQEIEKDLKKKNEEKIKIPDTKYESENDETNELQRFLLEGPIMSDEQFDDFKKLRKAFNKWLNK
jgi:hypothetical protein